MCDNPGSQHWHRGARSLEVSAQQAADSKHTQQQAKKAEATLALNSSRTNKRVSPKSSTSQLNARRATATLVRCVKKPKRCFTVSVSE